MSAYQYAKSTDPEVITTIQRNAEGRVEWAKKAMAWAKERGSDACYQSAFAGGFHVTGLPSIPEGRGAWTKDSPHRPHKKNADEYAIFIALRFRSEPVPGLPSLVYGRMDSDWRTPLMTPRPFIHDGAAWVGLPSAPDDDQRQNDDYGPQWVEVRASEFYAAAEAESDRRKDGAR